MEDGVDNGMIIYILLTEQSIAAEFSIENFNYIPLHFKTTAKRCTEISPDLLLGENKFHYKEPLKIFEGHFSSVCVLEEIYAVSRYRLISYSFGNLKALTI